MNTNDESPTTPPQPGVAPQETHESANPHKRRAPVVQAYNIVSDMVTGLNFRKSDNMAFRQRSLVFAFPWGQSWSGIICWWQSTSGEITTARVARRFCGCSRRTVWERNLLTGLPNGNHFRGQARLNILTSLSTSPVVEAHCLHQDVAADRRGHLTRTTLPTWAATAAGGYGCRFFSGPVGQFAFGDNAIVIGIGGGEHSREPRAGDFRFESIAILIRIEFHQWRSTSRPIPWDQSSRRRLPPGQAGGLRQRGRGEDGR